MWASSSIFTLFNPRSIPSSSNWSRVPLYQVIQSTLGVSRDHTAPLKHGRALQLPPDVPLEVGHHFSKATLLW